MNKYIPVVVLSLLSALAQASPFVVYDPLDPIATHCGVLLDTAAKVEVPVAVSGADKICKFDLVGISTGTHTIKMTAIANDSVWGRLESATSTPFTFVKPGVGTALKVPGGLAITP